jgi:hypothetical protein
VLALGIVPSALMWGKSHQVDTSADVSSRAEGLHLSTTFVPAGFGGLSGNWS